MGQNSVASLWIRIIYILSVLKKLAELYNGSVRDNEKGGLPYNQITWSHALGSAWCAFEKILINLLLPISYLSHFSPQFPYLMIIIISKILLNLSHAHTKGWSHWFILSFYKGEAGC